MMLTEQVSLTEAVKIDFAGKTPGFQSFAKISDDVVVLLRKPAQNKLLIIVDRGYGFKTPAAYVVSDHLNLTGGNPLVGPNDPVGERFPSVNALYLTGCNPETPTAIVAGVKEGIKPSADEVKLIHSLGGDCYSYNLVPTALVAAHAGWKILGIVIPEGADAEPIVQAAIKNYRGAKA